VYLKLHYLLWFFRNDPTIVRKLFVSYIIYFPRSLSWWCFSTHIFSSGQCYQADIWRCQGRPRRLGHAMHCRRCWRRWIPGRGKWGCLGTRLVNFSAALLNIYLNRACPLSTLEIVYDFVSYFSFSSLFLFAWSVYLVCLYACTGWLDSAHLCLAHRFLHHCAAPLRRWR